MKAERNSELYTLILIFLSSFSYLALPIDHFLKSRNPWDIIEYIYLFFYIDFLQFDEYVVYREKKVRLGTTLQGWSGNCKHTYFVWLVSNLAQRAQPSENKILHKCFTIFTQLESIIKSLKIALLSWKKVFSGSPPLFKAPNPRPSLPPLFKIFLSPPLFSIPPPFKVF